MRLKELINQPKKLAIKEAKSDKVFDLYAYAGFKTKYSDDVVKRYGEDVVKDAVKRAPKYIQFAKDLRNLLNSSVGKEWGLIAQNHSEYGGSYSIGSPEDVVKLIMHGFSK